MDQQHILSTEQLVLREFKLDDAPFILELVNSPKWIEFIGDRKIKTIEEAQGYLTTGPLKSYKENGYGLWLVELKENKQAVGMCGLIKRDYLECADIGFAFLPNHLGKGYGSESASATLRYAKKNLSLEKIFAITDTKNIVSIKLLNKIGLHFEKSIRSPQNETLLLFAPNDKKAEESEINTLTKKFFTVFSNGSKQTPNLNILKSFCIPDIRIIKNTDTPEIYTLQEFITPREKILTNGTLSNFIEEEISHTTQVFGKIAQRFSLYIKRGELNSAPFETLGVKTFQFIQIEGQWKISAIAWSDEV